MHTKNKTNFKWKSFNSFSATESTSTFALAFRPESIKFFIFFFIFGHPIHHNQTLDVERHPQTPRSIIRCYYCLTNHLSHQISSRITWSEIGNRIELHAHWVHFTVVTSHITERTSNKHIIMFDTLSVAIARAQVVGIMTTVKQSTIKHIVTSSHSPEISRGVSVCVNVNVKRFILKNSTRNFKWRKRWMIHRRIDKRSIVNVHYIHTVRYFHTNWCAAYSSAQHKRPSNLIERRNEFIVSNVNSIIILSRVLCSLLRLA